MFSKSAGFAEGRVDLKNKTKQAFNIHLYSKETIFHFNFVNQNLVYTSWYL